MTRRATLRKAAEQAMREDAPGSATSSPQAAADIRAVLDDPALGEALAAVAASGRLSDAAVHAMHARRRRAAGAGLVTVLVAALGIGMWAGSSGSPAPAIVQHIETGRGEQRTIRLADNSTVELDGATSLDVRIDGRFRAVTMQRGEAYFDVAHEQDRPFVVRAGASSVRVLGTAFSVDIGARAVKLAVYRGKVRFGDTGDADRGVDVPAGWRSNFARGTAAAPTRFDATQQDWRQSWVDTDDMVLGELVEALNRRGGPSIAAAPARLARLPLSGRFKLDRAEELLGAVGEVYGFEVVHEGERLRLAPAGNNDAKSSPK